MNLLSNTSSVMELIVLLVEAWLHSFWELEEGKEYEEGCSDKSFKISSVGMSITVETLKWLILGGVILGSGNQSTICGLDLIVLFLSLTLT